MSDLIGLRNYYSEAIKLYCDLRNQYSTDLELLKNCIENEKIQSINQDTMLGESISNLNNHLEIAFHESSRLMRELRLKRSTPEQYSISGKTISPRVLIEEIRNIKNICDQSLDNLRVYSTELIELRKKWWKFW